MKWFFVIGLALLVFALTFMKYENKDVDKMMRKVRAGKTKKAKERILQTEMKIAV